jgi:uncharacterized protein with PIN domain
MPSNCDDSPAFWCDAMLGGLARWLRAAGYDAAWVEGIDDTDLVRRALATRRILLTCDTGLMKHGAIAGGRVRALLLPPGLSKLNQLRFVLKSLALGRRPTRCMACGGELMEIPKESARPEAPPRSFAWCDAFFRCRRCAKLFWRGTHWQRIEMALGGS